MESEVKTSIDKEWLSNYLLEMPRRIHNAEMVVIERTIELNRAKNRLADAEAKLLAEGVEGKNAEQRAAIVRLKTEKERKEVEELEESLMYEKMAFNWEINTFSALKAVARLLAKEAE